MTPALDPSSSSALVLAGWSLAFVIWLSTLAALSVAIRRAVGSGASPESEYRAALAALAGVVVLAGVVPIVLATTSARVTPQKAVASASGMPGRAAEPGERSGPVAVMASPVVIDLNATAAWLAAVWAVGSLLLLGRLSGGWAVTIWVRRRASKPASPALCRTVDAIAASWRLPSAPLLVSPHVESPCTVGVWRPVILLPPAAEDRLAAAEATPLLAHELAHVWRRDYVVSLAQTLVEAVLWMSPAVWWLSRRIREGREFCCDDRVIALGHDRRAYVDALTRLAALGAVARPRSALGAAGPRLVTRIRRLLEEDAMPARSNARLAALLTLGFVLVAPARDMLSAATSALAARQEEPTDVRRSFAHTQQGSGVVLHDVRGDGAAICGAGEVRNVTDVAVVAIRFIVVAADRGGFDRPVSLVTSDWVETSIAPSASVTVPIGLMSAADARRLGRGQSAQVMCGVTAVRFANGAAWSLTPNPAARTAEEALGLARPEIPRVLVGAPGTTGVTAYCRDAGGAEYSEGALVPVRHEPGRFARCTNGRWTDAPPRGR